jgi:hypothetical protein
VLKKRPYFVYIDRANGDMVIGRDSCELGRLRLAFPTEAEGFDVIREREDSVFESRAVRHKHVGDLLGAPPGLLARQRRVYGLVSKTPFVRSEGVSPLEAHHEGSSPLHSSSEGASMTLLAAIGTTSGRLSVSTETGLGGGVPTAAPGCARPHSSQVSPRAASRWFVFRERS